MAQACNLTATLQLRGSKTNDTGEVESASTTLALDHAIALANGVAANQADLIFTDKHTLSASDSKEYDLSDLVDPSFGNAMAFVTVKRMVIINESALRQLTIGDAASNPFEAWLGGTNPTVKIPPSGVLWIDAPIGGWTVGAGVNLKITNASGGNTAFQIWIVGTSA